MKSEILAIYDIESSYARSFMEYLSQKNGIPFKIVAFNELEELKRYSEEREIDILLISAAEMNQEISTYKIGRIILLSEGEICSEYIQHPTIYKYQSAENVLREVMNYYADMHKDKGISSIVNSHNVDIIGVYSPIGRSGKTTFALTMGQIIAAEKSVLYLNMEEFSGFSRLFSKNYGGDLADLMYFYRQAPDSIGIKLKAVASSIHGMDYVPPMIFSNDIRNIESHYWVNMVKDIAVTGMYEVIILDISNMVSHICDILEVCTCIYMPINDDRISLHKVSEYEEYMLRTQKEEIVNKTVKIKVPGCDMKEWNENYIEEQLWGELGDFVRKIIKEDVA